jgi:hypothetical protein
MAGRCKGDPWRRNTSSATSPTKPAFRVVFWATVLLNVVGLVVLASPIRQSLLRTLRYLLM